MIESATLVQAQQGCPWPSQIQTSVHTGVAMGTLSEILQKDHIPQIETLFRLTDHFCTDRVEILILVGHLQRADTLPRGQHPDLDISTALADTSATQSPDQTHLNYFRHRHPSTRLFIRADYADGPRPFPASGSSTQVSGLGLLGSVALTPLFAEWRADTDEIGDIWNHVVNPSADGPIDLSDRRQWLRDLARSCDLDYHEGTKTSMKRNHLFYFSPLVGRLWNAG